MNKKTFIIIIFIVSLVCIGIYLNVNSSKQYSSNGKSRTYDKSSNVPATASESGRYKIYSKLAFDAASDKRRVLYFHAPWCPICQPLDKALSSNPNQIPKGVVIFKTDYDTQTALKTNFGVTYQHTFVEIDSQGNAVQIWNGGEVAEIISRLQ